MREDTSWIRKHAETIVIIAIICVVDLLILSTNLFDVLLSDELEFIRMGLDSPFYFLYEGFLDKYYRPLPLLLIQCVYYVFGLYPLPYHLINLGLQILNHLLIYLIAKSVFKSRLTPFLCVMLGLIFACVYYETYFWISTYFDLIFTTCCLLGTYFFIQARIHEKHPQRNFYLAILFITIGFLAKETAFFLAIGFLLFEIAQYNFFDFSNFFTNLKDLIRNNWRYLAFIPLLGLLLMNRFIINPRLGETLDMFLNPVILLALGGGAIFALSFYLLFQYKLKRPLTHFFIIETSLFSFLIFFHRASRSYYLPLLFAPFIIFLFLDNHDYSLFEWAKKIKQIRSPRIFLIATLCCSLVTGSTVLLLFHKRAFNDMSLATRNVLDYLGDVPDIESKTIYLINLPDYTLLYWGVVDRYFEHGMYLHHSKTCNITQYFVYGNRTRTLDMMHRDFKKFWYQYLPADDLSISAYNNLTNTTLNPDNRVYLFDYATFSLKNVTNIPYYSW